ncbi:MULTISPECIES: hypothetical protein [Streptomyces]|uniref:hypothetical protein n=1 Tax=Streptomyces TaxID=1883 RepID=UPI001331C067|nr:hypothetical protein [Streptomyces sp. 2323.1]
MSAHQRKDLPTGGSAKAGAAAAAEPGPSSVTTEKLRVVLKYGPAAVIWLHSG